MIMIEEWFNITRHSKKWRLLGYIYIGLPCGMIIDMRYSFPDIRDTLILFIFVWATDIGAYIVGTLCKGPKLMKHVSPNKTISGAVGGLIITLFVGYIVDEYHLSYYTNLAIIISIAAQIGDLFESWVKRRFGVKDSGYFLPGHGGILDRMDGILVAAVAYFLVTYLWHA